MMVLDSNWCVVDVHGYPRAARLQPVTMGAAARPGASSRQFALRVLSSETTAARGRIRESGSVLSASRRDRRQAMAAPDEHPQNGSDDGHHQQDEPRVSRRNVEEFES